MEMSRQETIHADPGEVWAFAIDVERWPEVMDHIDRIRLHDQTGFGVGSAATIEHPRLQATVWTVDAFVPGRRFRWLRSPGGITMTADHIVEPAGDSATTQLTLSVTATGWRATVLGPLLKRQAAQALHKEFVGFRTVCE